MKTPSALPELALAAVLVGLSVSLMVLPGCGDVRLEPRVTTPTAFVQEPPLVEEDPEPEPSPSPTPAPTYTVLRDWGWMGTPAATDGQMPVDFSAMTLGTQTGYILWFQYEPGHFGESGREYRRCRAKFTLTGTEEAGTLTVSQSEIVWSVAPAEAVYFHECPTTLDGDYTYTVDENGMVLDGVVYE